MSNPFSAYMNGTDEHGKATLVPTFLFFIITSGLFLFACIKGVHAIDQEKSKSEDLIVARNDLDRMRWVAIIGIVIAFVFMFMVATA